MINGLQHRRETTRYQEAQAAEWRAWHGLTREFDRGALVREFELLGVDVLKVAGRVLDIGGAYGAYASVFADASERIVVDPLYERLEVHLDGVKGVSTSGEDLPFDSGSAGFIILRNVIDHMLDPARLLKESQRVLSVNGIVYFMVNTFLSVTKPLFPIMDRYDRPHPIHFTVDGVRKLIVNSGFRIDKERVASSGTFAWHPKRIAGRLIKREYHALLTRQ